MWSENTENNMNSFSASFFTETATATNRVDRLKSGLQRRYRKERRFRIMGLMAIVASILFLSLLFLSIVSKGYTAFWQSEIRLTIFFDPQYLGDNLETADYQGLIKSALATEFPEMKNRAEKRLLNGLVSSGAGYRLRKLVMADRSLIGTTQTIWIILDDDVDMYLKGYITFNPEEKNQRLATRQFEMVDQLESKGVIAMRFNTSFFSAGDSREPELAGIWGAVAGSFYTLIVTLLLSFPIGVAAAIYLEEFAPKNRITDVIEVNINNLAAVPSIVFGLLGLAVFLNFFNMPRSAPLVGGLVLSLMTLPTIIIASRVALKSVPPSIRDAALAVGASKMQTIFHHVLPLAMPGMLTGTIIGMARALGETAPLLMIGMVAFIVDIPGGFNDPATVLPVQVFLWADSPERGFVEKTSAAIMILLVFLVVMNATAVYLRNKFEKRW
jgi:phosphate transport system permease protein